MSTRISSCLLCGCKCKQYLFATYSNDPGVLSDEIERLDTAIHRLCVLKSERCHQLNTIRSSTRIFPNEILLSIFQVFSSLFPSQEFPQFILGGVCRRWRTLVNSNPRLWKTIDLQINNKCSSVSRAVSLLEVFKDHNRASFEFMQLKFDMWEDLPFRPLLPSLNGIATSRITVHRPPVLLSTLISSNIDTHDVSLTDVPYTDFPIASWPFALPWLTLMTLHLSRTSIDICYGLLLGCPNLTEFSSYDPLRGNQPTTQHAQKTGFPRLQHLIWHHLYPEWDNTLLSFYRFPALEHFHWHGDQPRHSLQLFEDFTSSLPQSCRIFQLSEEGLLQEEILLRMAHPIEQLICSPYDTDDLFIVLEKLQDPTFIPSLAFFKCEIRDFEYWYDDTNILNLIRSLLGAARTRKEISVEGFRMEIAGFDCCTFLEEYDTEKIYEFMSSNWFKFDMTEDGRWIMSF